MTNKTIPILRRLKNVKQCIGIDHSQSFLGSACELIKDQFAIRASGINADFITDDIRLSGDNRLGLMLGSTVSNQSMREGNNFPASLIISSLQHLRKTIGDGQHMLISYDANPDPESAMAAYSDINWPRHVTGIMYDVAKYAKGDFDPSAWTHEIVWDGAAHVINQCAVATRAQAFSIDDHDIRIEKGERFVTVNNFKYPPGVFRELCEAAQFKVGPAYVGRGNRQHIQELTVA